jgi:hypothetical protein
VILRFRQGCSHRQAHEAVRAAAVYPPASLAVIAVVVRFIAFIAK